MKLHDLVLTSGAVRATSSRLEKIGLLAGLLSRLEPDEVPIAIGFLIGWPRQGKIGVGWATVAAARPAPSSTPELTIHEVDQRLDALKATSGKRSAAERRRLLDELLSRATIEEQELLLALLAGEVRQGALEGVMTEAVASAAKVPAERVRRAVMLAGDLGTVAAVLMSTGESVLAGYGLELFRPVQPMLAESAASVAEAMAALGGEAVLEYKLDGARIQVHRQNDRVAVYTRSLNDVTAAVPEVVEAVLRLPNREFILDGEVIALAADGRPLPFQETMRRFGRKIEVETLRAELPLSPFFFDLLRFDGTDLIDLPLITRLEWLDAVVYGAMRVQRIHAENAEDAGAFYAKALALGHEGIMAKAPNAPYAAGRRGAAWLKIKTAHTLDLVVLAAEWGSGRRKGWLSNLHLGARDPATGGWVMLGKTFKGMTDAVLAWQTTELLAREVGREGRVVRVRPELVVEVAFNDVQQSPQYPGGVALRFARIKGYRPDKRPEEADTIETVRGLAPLSALP